MIKHTTFRDVNGNRRVKIDIEVIAALYADFCKGANIKGDNALKFGGVLARLKERFGYRIQRKAKVPTVTATFDGESELKAELFDSIVFAVTDGKVQHSRVRYMDAVRRCTHNEYYSQFITPHVYAMVRNMMPDLLRSRKQCFNDNNYLTNKVSVTGLAADLCRIAQATTYVEYRCGGISLSDSVCIAKSAARAALIDHLGAYDTDFKITDMRNGFSVVEHYNGFHFMYDDKVIAPRDVIAALSANVPVVFDRDVYKLISSYMFVQSNKDMLCRIIVNSKMENTDEN